MYDINVLLFLSHSVFTLSLIIFVCKGDNVFTMFILSEIMLISGAINFVIYSYYFQHSGGQAVTLIIFALGAAGAGIGLVIIINFVKLQNTLSIAY